MRVGDVGVEHDCTGASERERERGREPEGGYRWWRMVYIRGPGGGVGGGDSSGSCGQSEGIVAMTTGRLRPPACSTQRSPLAGARARASERGHAYTREREMPVSSTRAHCAHTLASFRLILSLACARARACIRSFPFRRQDVPDPPPRHGGRKKGRVPRLTYFPLQLSRAVSLWNA